jgi:tyrosyl-tRNA synthetase
MKLLPFNGRSARASGESTDTEAARLMFSKFTVAQMLERNDFQKRMAANEAIALHKLLYPLVQAYDSVALECDVELGVNDQLFNLMRGRDLQTACGQGFQVVLTVPLLLSTQARRPIKATTQIIVTIDVLPFVSFAKQGSFATRRAIHGTHGLRLPTIQARIANNPGQNEQKIADLILFRSW